MRVGYIRDKRPWSIATQAKILVDYGCQAYWVERPLYEDQSEWTRLVSEVRAGDEVVIASLLVFGDTPNQVNEALTSLTKRGASLVNWGEVFHVLPKGRLSVDFQQDEESDTQDLPMIDSELVDAIREAYVTGGWSVTDISGHFLLSEAHVREALLLLSKD